MASTRLAIATSVGGTRLGIRNGLRFWLARAGTVPAFIVVATDFLGAGLQGRRFAPVRPMDAR
jgi:hypothetical protein